MKKSLALLFAFAAVMSRSTKAEAPPGPLSPYYLTAGEQGNNWVVQNQSVIRMWSQNHPQGVGEYAIAVTDMVRDLGSFYLNSTSKGSQYTLDGTFTGVSYSYPLAKAAFWDGATDGNSNYSVDFNRGGVYSFNSDWTNPQLLFSTASDYLGITFDVTTNTIWIATFHSSSVEHRDLSGAGVAGRFTMAEILRRIRRLEELRDHLGRNIQETLAIEVAFLRVFGA